MGDKVRFAGYYELPNPVIVTDDVLGTVCPTRIGGVDAQIHTPLPGRDNGGFAALPPVLPGIPLDNPRIATPWDWVMRFEDDGVADQAATCLRRIGVVMDEPPVPVPVPSLVEVSRVTRLGMAALEGMDEWVEGLRTWVQVLTKQDLDHRLPRSDVSYLGAGLWISNELAPGIQLSQIEPIDLRRWRLVLERVGRHEEPPLEFLLARDAQVAYQRGELRRAAIDAGTATEMAIHQRYQRAPVDSPTSSTTTQETLGLSAWSKELHGSRLDLPVSPDAVEAVITARDRAVRGDAVTDAEELRDNLRTMATLLAVHGAVAILGSSNDQAG